MSEEVVELSISETNKLRAELGLAPLRLSAEQKADNGDAPIIDRPSDKSDGQGQAGEETLELSVDETNALREKLGLPPLRTSKKKEIIHKPAENDRAQKQVEERIKQAKLRHDVQVGASKTFGSSTLADEANASALSWADRMRQQKEQPSSSSKPSKAKKKSKGTDYDEHDLQGIQVAHKMGDLEAGSTTVLTLADSSILQTKDDTSKKVIGLNEDEIALENVNLTEKTKQQDGLRRKRMFEMGMGHAGGYAGFDDDEFEELGGTLGPARKQRGNAMLQQMDGEESGKVLGFRIGALDDTNGDASMTDFDRMQMGKAISLVSEKPDGVANDYMTLEEVEAERAEKEKRKKLKDSKFKKKKKKKKDRKRRQTEADSEEEDDTQLQSSKAKKNIIDQLEATAIPQESGLRKRRRMDDEDEDTDQVVMGRSSRDENQGSKQPADDKASRYHEVMEKGNERSKKAFAPPPEPKTRIELVEPDLDDAFLDAAISKARRINRLRELNQSSTTKGAEAVVEAVKSMSNFEASKPSVPSGGVSFKVDDTQEFALALQARENQKAREAEKLKKQRAAKDVLVKKKADPIKEEQESTILETVEEGDDDDDMEELAKEVKTDDLDDDFAGSTSRSKGVGRGLSSFVSMLKTTGEISGKKAGREELKGRAKDERNYEDYQPMDLSKVVKIGPNATAKDIEMANREIKLERRDKDGRLLTTKEAFRDLCYQFHGHGPSRRQEEKRRRQTERDQLQARMASSQVAAARDGTTAGTFGALKATQKATGKAFVVHKT